MRLQHKRLILLHFCFVVYKLIKANLQLLRGCMLKLKRHLLASTTTKGGNNNNYSNSSNNNNYNRSNNNDNNRPSTQKRLQSNCWLALAHQRHATPPAGPAKGLIVGPFTRYLCVPPLLLLSLFCRPRQRLLLANFLLNGIFQFFTA